MKNRKWRRIICLALALCLLSGVLLSVNALFFVGDVNGDGRISAFDAQLLAEAKAGLRELTESQKVTADNATIQDVLAYIFGNTAVDSGDMDADGVIELYTVESLQLLRDDPAGSYILMADLDLQGAAWTPLSLFTGSLNGNGHTISNFSITQGASSAADPNSAAFNMGFFGDLPSTGTVTDLHLRNVQLTATEEALYMGLLSGTNRGAITDCTATGTITDDRTAHGTESGSLTFLGALVGRIADPSAGFSAGSVVGGDTVSVYDENGQYETTGLCAEVTFRIADRAGVNLVSGVSQKIGVVGWAPSDATVSGIWCDQSYSSDLLSEAVQNRQDVAVNYMNKMGTVAWTPTETLVFSCNPESSYDASKTYYAGTTYYGLPYNYKNGSYERFLSAMEYTDDSGVLHTKTGLGDSIYTVNEEGEGGYDGFIQIMGNDCATAVSWAWRQISPTRVNPGPNDNQAEYAGGAYGNRVRYMIPNDEVRQTNGIYPVGDWVSSIYDPDTNTWTKVEYDPSLAAYPISDELSSEDILLAYGEDVLLEAYAKTHKADALARLRADLVTDEEGNQSYSRFGHSRMVAADPVVIRTADGTIDGALSYMLTSEQGSSTGKTSTWKINYRRSFSELCTHNEENPYNNTGPYLPVTIRALRDEATKPAYVTTHTPLTGPVSGKFYSNYGFTGLELTVTDQAGNVCYDKLAFTGVSFSDSAARTGASSADLAALHGQSFAEAAGQTMTEGQTYLYTVIAHLSNGQQINLNEKYMKESATAFVYTP